jgi:hypothetical protein
MTKEVSDIRKKAFEDEMRIIVPELHRVFCHCIYSSAAGGIRHSAFKAKLDRYLDVAFGGYVQWHYQILDECINFNVAHTHCVDFTPFSVSL